MDRGTYIAASGGMLQLRTLDVVANNLSNLNTPGFKRQFLVNTRRAFESTLSSVLAPDVPSAEAEQEISPEVGTISSFTDFSPGPLKQTGNHLDVALAHPQDFFVVETPEGQQYTRAGNFSLNSEGNLVTQDGSTVQGDGGVITVQGGSAKIGSNGDVLVDGASVGRLQVVRMQNLEDLQPVGGSRFALAEGSAAGEVVEADLHPATLEMSNVTAVRSMIDLISANRAFQLYTKSAKAVDEMNNLSISKVGKPTA